MDFMEELKALGVDTDEGLDRVMDDKSLYEMMLGMFVDTVRQNPIAPEAFQGGDLEPLTHQVHTLKGTTGNLALTPLFNGYNQTLMLLRAGQPARAKEEFERLLPVQEKIIACIEQNKNRE